MMKTTEFKQIYDAPQVEVMEFDALCVITASPTAGGENGEDGGIW